MAETSGLSGTGGSAPTSAPATTRKHVLDPTERASEVLFGVIMALTFTGSISAVAGQRDEIRTLLVTAVTCNVAWGIIDGVMYLMACLAERGEAWRVARAFRAAHGTTQAREVIEGTLPPAVAKAIEPAVLEAMRVSISRSLVDPPPPRIRAADVRGAVAVFLLVTLSTLPIAVPFLLVQDAHTALRVSNGVALCMLFSIGWMYGKSASLKPLAAGAAMVALGVVLVAITIAFGG